MGGPDSHTQLHRPLPPAVRTPVDREPPGATPPGEPAGPPPGERPPDAGPRPPARARDPFFDNAKYLAIVLVACGHSWEPFRGDSRAATALYMFVYAFHMPAFIMISGYFSRGFDYSARKIRRLATGVLVPYLIFETLYAYFRRWADHDPTYPVNLADPWFVSWFLLALFLWRLSTPLWESMRWPLPVAVAVGAVSSVFPDMGTALDIQRVLQFLPFFVAGLLLRAEHFERIRQWGIRLPALLVGAGGLVVAYWAVPRLNYQWFYHRDTGQELGVTAWVGGAMNLALFGCSLVLAVCFLSWVPKRRRWFTALGTGTLYGYLLHGFLVKGSGYWDWYDDDWLFTPPGMVVVTLIAAVVVTLLCTAPVRRVFRFLVEPRMDWLFRKEPASGSGPRTGTEAGARTNG